MSLKYRPSCCHCSLYASTYHMTNVICSATTGLLNSTHPIFLVDTAPKNFLFQHKATSSEPCFTSFLHSNYLHMMCKKLGLLWRSPCLKTPRLLPTYSSNKTSWPPKPNHSNTTATPTVAPTRSFLKLNKKYQPKWNFIPSEIPSENTNPNNNKTNNLPKVQLSIRTGKNED